MALARLEQVARLRWQGKLQQDIAAALGVSGATICRDYKRLDALWQERTQREQTIWRSEVVAELEDTARLALDDHAFDLTAERAVLLDEPIPDAQGEARQVARNQYGEATFRGQRSAHLDNRRKALMDKAKVLGLIVDKQEHDVSQEFLSALREFGRAVDA